MHVITSRYSLWDEVEYRPRPVTNGNDLLFVYRCYLQDLLSVTLINAAHVRDQHLRRQADVHILVAEIIADDHGDRCPGWLGAGVHSQHRDSETSRRKAESQHAK